MKWWQTGQTGVSNSVFSTGSLHDAWQGKAARPIWILRAKSIMARIVKLSDKKPDIRKQLHLKIITNFACKTGGVHIRWKTICVAAAVLKTDSKCSFIKHKLRFFACFCLASATSKTFFNGLLTKIIGKSDQKSFSAVDRSILGQTPRSLVFAN